MENTSDWWPIRLDCQLDIIKSITCTVVQKQDASKKCCYDDISVVNDLVNKGIDVDPQEVFNLGTFLRCSNSKHFLEYMKRTDVAKLHIFDQMIYLEDYQILKGEFFIINNHIIDIRLQDMSHMPNNIFPQFINISIKKL